jgi:hypothetical protein
LIHNGGRHPAERTTPGGTSSMWMRTGMRCAKRTQVKVGLRVRDVDRAGDAVDAPARDLIMTHQLNLARSPTRMGARFVSSKYPSAQNESASRRK